MEEKKNLNEKVVLNKTKWDSAADNAFKWGSHKSASTRCAVVPSTLARWIKMFPRVAALHGPGVVFLRLSKHSEAALRTSLAT